MNATLSGVIEHARREWAGNPRLRLGVMVIGAILALYLALVLRDWSAALQQDYTTASARLHKMQSLAGQEEWLARADSARQLREGLEAEIPDIATLGLAQAGAQTWLRDITTAFGSTVRVETQPAARVSEDDDVWRVPVVLAGTLDPPKLLQLLQQIESHGTLVVVEQALWINRANRTFSLTVVSFFRIKEPPADATD